MEPLYRVEIDSYAEKKEIAVYLADATNFDEPIDILTISAYYNDYMPIPGTLIRALYENRRTSVMKLASNPEIDLRSFCHIWLSHEIEENTCYTEGKSPIGRIGCVELIPYQAGNENGRDYEDAIIKGIKAYFQMLDLAATYGMQMNTIAFPFLGAGSQHVDQEFVKYPLINECINCLKRNSSIKKIVFLEKSPQKAFSLASTLEKSYAVKNEMEDFKNLKQTKSSGEEKQKAFISYSTKDKKAADILCRRLEKAGIDVWYAPRDIIKDDYATAIVMAIREASLFITMISRNSMHSEHVLNEIDVAFKRLTEKSSLIPLRLDDEELIPAFEYYLSRFQWMNFMEPYEDDGLNELIKRIIE